MVHKDRKTLKIPDDCPYKNNGWNPILCGFCPNYCEDGELVPVGESEDNTVGWIEEKSEG